MPTLEEQNRDNMKKKWLPSQGMEPLIYQNVQGMALFMNNSFTDKQLVSAFILQIIDAGVYAPYLKDWHTCGEDNMKFVDAKKFWRKHHIQMWQDCAGRNFGFGLNMQVFDADTDDVSGERDEAANHATAMEAMPQKLEELQLQQQQHLPQSC